MLRPSLTSFVLVLLTTLISTLPLFAQTNDVPDGFPFLGKSVEILVNQLGPHYRHEIKEDGWHLYHYGPGTWGETTFHVVGEVVIAMHISFIAENREQHLELFTGTLRNFKSNYGANPEVTYHRGAKMYSWVGGNIEITLSESAGVRLTQYIFVLRQ